MSINKGVEEARFKQLLERLPGSPLYREKLSGINLDKTGLDQLSTLPLTTKEDLRKAGTYGHLAVEMNRVAQYHESTGTTGEPSASWFTQEDLRRGGRQIAECGVALTSDDLVLVRFPYALALPAFLMQQAAWQTGAGVVPASGRTVVTPNPRVLNLLRRLGVTVMAGLPREMELLAETARLLGIAPNSDFPELRAICVAGELMSDGRRRHIENLWGVQVFNMYGSTETANIATMCRFGSMHIVEEDFIVEALREDGAGPAAQGERGYAAITTLTHQATPLLRYFNEDIVSIESSACSCGRRGGMLRHYGRSKDRIRIGGAVLDAYDIQEAVYGLSPVPDAWKVYEQEEGLLFALDSHDAGGWTEERLRQDLTKALRVPVSVRLVKDNQLLDRSILVNNDPSTKPVYIQKREQKGGPI
ncbi:phenylacetate--CoA ligase family protein [Paenibacillus nanensis]|uniref:Phenylacetate--CoA ligase family protein n=1 Tax=Paenibacillus nanensis TaxID=393251 RepID=A0A3A1V294_9BACL|nr:AMP-binding protein [Paenibacillus nanensis]RIX53941.1 phenylacetate--CoA ligase family protein [Paenibacillus nanensis]